MQSLFASMTSLLPKNGKIALRFPTNSLMCSKYVSQKRKSPLIRTNGTTLYSILHCNLRELSSKLKCMYSVISVVVDSLPSAKNLGIRRSWRLECDSSLLGRFLFFPWFDNVCTTERLIIRNNNRSNFSIHYQHTNSSLQDNIHVSKVHCVSDGSWRPAT